MAKEATLLLWETFLLTGRTTLPLLPLWDDALQDERDRYQVQASVGRPCANTCPARAQHCRTQTSFHLNSPEQALGGLYRRSSRVPGTRAMTAAHLSGTARPAC
ncbi:hypothetical protein OH77DRAFT_206653 [Trametes cingulata]|nr:hypothetical protein OH77DRAFT_206653 [Trametes cingulata]